MRLPPERRVAPEPRLCRPQPHAPHTTARTVPDAGVSGGHPYDVSGAGTS